MRYLVLLPATLALAFAACTSLPVAALPDDEAPDASTARDAADAADAADAGDAGDAGTEDATADSD